MIHVAFTGPRSGMTDQQVLAITVVMENLVKKNPGEVTAHHGCALGADKQFHTIAKTLGLPIVGYPTIVQPADEVDQYVTLHPPMMPLPRNRIMVQNCDALIVGPAESMETTRGGTWMTKRQADKAGKAYIVVVPNGASAYGPKDWPA